MRALRASSVDIIVFLLMITMAYLASRVISENPGLTVSGWIFGIAPVAAVGAVIVVIKMGEQSGYDILSFFKFSQHNLNVKILFAVTVSALVIGFLVLSNPFGFIVPTFTVAALILFSMSVSMAMKNKMVDAIGLLLILLPFINYIEFEIGKLTDFDPGWITMKVAAILLFTFIWLISSIAIHKTKMYKGKFNTLVLIFMFTTFVSAVFSADILYSLERWLFEIIYPLIFYFIVINSIRKEADGRKFINYLIGSVFLNLIMAIYYFIKYGSQVAYNEYVLNLNFANGVLLAEVMIIIIPVIFAFMVITRKKKLKLLYSMLIVLSVVGLAVSYSRMAQLCLAAELLALLLIKEARKYIVLLLTLAAVLLTFHIGKLDPLLIKYKEFSSFQDIIYAPSMEKRYEDWNAGLEMFKDRPITGIGIGRYIQEHENYGTLYFSVWQHDYLPMISAHNMYINFLAETGVLGTLSLLAVFYAIISSVYRLFKKAVDNRTFVFSLLVSVVIFMFLNLVSGVVFTYVNDIDKGVVFWSIVAVIMSYSALGGKQDTVQLQQEHIERA